MQKVKIISLYNSKTLQIYNVTAIKANGDKMCLLSYNIRQKAQPYRYEKFQDMQKDILSIAKNNNCYVGYTKEFESKLYNIYWIDISNPYHVNRIYM